jgi:outer membrane protein assembly factor BamB
MKTFTLIAGLFLTSAALHAENWPQFRGPTGQGISAETNLPLKWSSTENVAWKTPIPGQSWSSPIVWADRVFLATATDNGVSCRVLCLDRATGSVLWNKEVLRQTTAGRKEGRNSYATPTPATDGKLVFAVFFDGSFAALNFAGDVVWTNRSYPFYSQHGLGTSPILWKDLLIQTRDGSNEGDDKGLGWQRPWDQAYILALDVKTGRERWKGHRGRSRISHGVPAIWEHDGKTEVVSEAGDVVQGFDFQTGGRLWSSEVIGEGKVPSTMIGEGLVFTAGGWAARNPSKPSSLAAAATSRKPSSSGSRRRACRKCPPCST